MMYQEFQPAPYLQRVIECYWTVRGVSDGRFRPIFPDGCTDLILNFGDALVGRTPSGLDYNRHPAFLVGNMTSPIHSGCEGVLHLLGVRFKPGGLSHFVKIPLCEITNASVAVSDVSTSFFPMERIRNFSLRDQLVFLDQFFGSKLTAASKPEVWQHCLRELMQGERASIDQVAQRAGISRKHLERKFKDKVGLLPKQLSSVILFRKLCRELEQNPPDNLLDLAVNHHFTDHAHFTKFFKQFSNLTPTEFRSQFA